MWCPCGKSLDTASGSVQSILNEQLHLFFIKILHGDSIRSFGLMSSGLLMKLLSCPTRRAKKSVATKFDVVNLAEHDTLSHGSSTYLPCRSCSFSSRHTSQFDMQLRREINLINNRKPNGCLTAGVPNNSMKSDIGQTDGYAKGIIG